METPPLKTALIAAMRQDQRSVAAILRAAGITDTQYYRWVKGSRDIRLVTADRLAAVLGVRASKRGKQ